MTEEEATEKWCPFYRENVAPRTIMDRLLGRFAVTSNRPGNEYYSSQDGPHCIGSSCMAWQWKIVRKDHPDIPKHPGEYENSDQGFCGMVHQPNLLVSKKES